MRTLALGFGLVTLATLAHADPQTDIGEFMKRPAYRSAYEAMVSDRAGLPAWMATPDAIADATTLKITKRLADGQDQSVFDLCKPDSCDTTGLLLIFTEGGAQAKGLLLDKEDQFLGRVDDGERAFLLQMKSKG